MEFQLGSVVPKDIYNQTFIQDYGCPPIAVNSNNELIAWEDLPDNEYPRIMTPRGLMVNSALTKEAWKRLDDAILEAAKQRLVGVNDVVSRGLTQPLGSWGVTISQYHRSSQMTAPEVTMSGASANEMDRVDLDLISVPVPIVHKTYQIGAREMASDALQGNPIDTTNAMEASFIVAEKFEDMLFNGLTSFQYAGNSVQGLTTETNVNSDTAGNYGGGDWGTAGNPEDTVAGMINTLYGDNFYGPFGVYASTTQYGEAVGNHNTDGSGDTGADRITERSDVEFLRIAPALADGTIVVVQLTRNVIDIAGPELAENDVQMMVQNAEWMSADGMTNYFKVFIIGVPRPKSDYAGRSGIAVATGA